MVVSSVEIRFCRNTHEMPAGYSPSAMDFGIKDVAGLIYKRYRVPWRFYHAS
jgi:hypothetical protein